MVTDLAEVFRAGTAKAEENVAFRRYLSRRHARDTPFQILASDIQQRVDCTACANCCRHSVVPVSAAEIDAIARHLEIPPREVVRLYTATDPEASTRRVLRTSPQGCVFLDRNLCLIYGARPKACRDFPHVAVGGHTLGGRPASLARWAALCPIVFNAIEEYKHATGFHPDER